MESSEAALCIGIGIGNIGRGRYRNIGVSAKMWHRPIPKSEAKAVFPTQHLIFLGILVNCIDLAAQPQCAAPVTTLDLLAQLSWDTGKAS